MMKLEYNKIAAIACIICAAFVAVHDSSNWGWFIFIALVIW